MEETIRILLIYEILGKPPEHIKLALEKFADEFNDKPNIKLLSKKVHEPKPLEKDDLPEGAKDLFTTFAEIELEIEDLNILFNIILNTLPANVEILSPSSLILKNFDLSGVLNELTVKLHKYDEVAKVLTLERNNLAKQVNDLIQQKQNDFQPQLNVKTNIKPDTEDKEEKTESKEDKTEEKENKEEDEKEEDKPKDK